MDCVYFFSSLALFCTPAIWIAADWRANERKRDLDVDGSLARSLASTKGSLHRFALVGVVVVSGPLLSLAADWQALACLFVCLFAVCS